jgi:hypothetical protein
MASICSLFRSRGRFSDYPISRSPDAPIFHPTPHSTFVENKGQTPFRPNGDRPVEAGFGLVSTLNHVISLSLPWHIRQLPDFFAFSQLLVASC